MSCTRSYFAVLIGILADEGAIRQHIDMAVGIHFIKDYAVG